MFFRLCENLRNELILSSPAPPPSDPSLKVFQWCMVAFKALVGDSTAWYWVFSLLVSEVLGIYIHVCLYMHACDFTIIHYYFLGYVRTYQGTSETDICSRKNSFHRTDTSRITRDEHVHIRSVPGKNYRGRERERKNEGNNGMPCFFLHFPNICIQQHLCVKSGCSFCQIEILLLDLLFMCDWKGVLMIRL